MISRIMSTLTILGLYIIYMASDWPDKEILLVAAIIVAISDAADRIIDKL